MGQALLQALNAFSHADLAPSVLAEERQEVCEAWQLAKQSDLEESLPTACRNDWISCGNTIFMSGFVLGDVAMPVEVSDMAKDDAESKTAIAIRVSLVIG
jgi:hypothetical protein